MMYESFSHLVHQRHCKRAFLNQAVDRSIIDTILNSAGQSASSKNTQPWIVRAVDGLQLTDLSQHLCEQFDTQSFDSPDYLYMMDPMPDSFKERARNCGYSLFQLKGIDRHDYDKRRDHTKENYRFFGAPTALFFFLPKDSERGNFLDLGLFLQTVMLGVTAHGLGSCPQASMMSFSSTIKAFLSLDTDLILVCGLSVGYPDPSEAVNTFVPKRLPLGEYFSWHS